MNGDSSIQFELAPISSPFGTLGKVGCLVSYAPTCFNPRVFQRSEDATAIGCLPIRWKELKTLAPGFQVKTIGVNNFIAHYINTPRPVGMIDALFDNVFVNQSALLPGSTRCLGLGRGRRRR